MIIRIHPKDPQPRHIAQVAATLRKGGIIIYPTDTIYGLGCDIFNMDAIERICRIKQIPLKKAQFSFICEDLSHLSDYARNIDTSVFRILRDKLPGPYTFVFNATKEVPKSLKMKKDTVGIRIPDCAITRALIHELGHPIMSVSLPMEGQVEYFTDPEVMEAQFGNVVDLVIDGGIGGMIPSTVVDFTSGTPELVREGAGEWS